MKQKVALVLSGGAARGIAHIGVIEALEAQGFEVNAISGTSMGSVIGAVYALGNMDAYKKWLYELNDQKIFNLIDFTFSGHGLLKGEKLIESIKAFIPDDSIENLEIPYAAVATDVTDRKEAVLTTGSVYEAVRASIAIPTIFTPAVKEGHLLIDGGAINNIPIDHVKREAGDILVVVDVNAVVEEEEGTVQKAEVQAPEKEKDVYEQKMEEVWAKLVALTGAADKEKDKKPEPIGFFDLLTRTLEIMMRRMNELQLRQYQPDIFIEISNKSAEIYDFDKAEYLVELGRSKTLEAIARYKEGQSES